MPTFRASFRPGMLSKGNPCRFVPISNRVSDILSPERATIIIPSGYSHASIKNLPAAFVRFFSSFFLFSLEFSGETKSKRSATLVVSHVTRLMHSGNVFPGILNGERDTESVFPLRPFLTTSTRPRDRSRINSRRDWLF